METRRIPLGDDGFFIVLPGTWAAIPLTSTEAITKRVNALVKKQLGTGDRMASRRRQFRDELVQTASDAAKEGAIAFSVALELLPGIPFSGAMLARWADWPPGTDAGLADPDRLAAAFPAATVLPVTLGAVARTATAGRQKYVDETTPSLRLEYWLCAPGTGRLLGIVVSLPMVAQPELFTELFDSMVDSISWDPIAGEAGSPVPVPGSPLVAEQGLS